jgi:hypothetical protein
VIIYKFKYTLLPSMSLAMPIQQPTASQYAAMCGAVGNPTTSVEPYAMDICGYFSSITDHNVQLLMRTMGTYYTTRRMSVTAAKRKSTPLSEKTSAKILSRIRQSLTSAKHEVSNIT